MDVNEVSIFCFLDRLERSCPENRLFKQSELYMFKCVLFMYQCIVCAPTVRYSSEDHLLTVDQAEE